jgi:hypothetical protein
MRYISVDSETLELQVRSRPAAPNLTIAVPRRTRKSALEAVDHPLSDAILYSVLYPAVYAEDRRKGRKVKYKLAPPEPWLVALGLVMWEGIVQGLSWEIVKLSVKAALTRLRSARLAPPAVNTSEKRASSTEIGFRWVRYASGRKQKEMFIGLRRKYNREVKRRDG